MNKKYVINFKSDEKACVWIALSDDVPGLVLEHGSLDALMERVRVAVPEVLEVNENKAKDIDLYYMTERHETVRMYG